MQPREKSCLRDVLKAGRLILRFTEHATLEQYEQDDLLRSGVERQFEIIGEALVRLRDIDDQWLERIPDAKRIIGFRNVLIHGYDAIHSERVWDAIQTNLPDLLNLVERLLGETRAE